jgi:glycosyltransferase involved in cell wall biosynthesis
MPVYNGEKYLSEAIDSILYQTYTDFEFIILNDGSTDNTEEIILSYDDPRIVYVKNEENLQIVETLNKGIALAKGKYIARMDADDISLPERFEKQLDILENHLSVQVIFSIVELVNENGVTIGSWKDDVDCHTQESMYSFLPRKNCFSHPSVMIRKDVAKNYLYINSKNSEDYNLWLRMMSDGIVFYKIAKPLLKYRIHQDSITQISNKNKNGGLQKNILAKYSHIIEKIKKLSLNWFDLKILRYMISDIFSLGKNLLMDLIKKILVRLGQIFYLLFPKKLKKQIYVFFPYYHMGGAEKVHASILEAISDLKPVLIMCSKSKDRMFFDRFRNSASRIFDFPYLLQNRISRNFLLGYFSSAINSNSNRVVLFSCYCSFFYELLPLLKRDKYRAIDLIHALTPENKNAVEIYTLPYLSFLSKRVVIGPQTYKDLERLYTLTGISSKELKKIEIIENGVPISHSNKKRDVTRFHILYVGRCSKEKRIYLIGEIAIQCHFLNLPVDFTLVGIGKDCIEKKYEKYCYFVEQEKDLEEYYSKAHMLLLTSIREGFPMVIMEAMSYGIVPISTNVGSIRYHIKTGINGFLINEKNEEDIIKAAVKNIQYVIQKKRFDNMSSLAYIYSKNNFSIDIFSKKYQKLFFDYLEIDNGNAR